MSTQTPHDLINKHVPHGSGTHEEAVRCDDVICSALSVLSDKWSFYKWTLLIIAWINQSLIWGLLHAAELYLATRSQGCWWFCRRCCFFFFTYRGSDMRFTSNYWWPAPMLKHFSGASVYCCYMSTWLYTLLFYNLIFYISQSKSVYCFFALFKWLVIIDGWLIYEDFSLAEVPVHSIDLSFFMKNEFVLFTFMFTQCLHVYHSCHLHCLTAWMLVVLLSVGQSNCFLNV